MISDGVLHIVVFGDVLLEAEDLGVEFFFEFGFSMLMLWVLMLFDASL